MKRFLAVIMAAVALPLAAQAATVDSLLPGSEIRRNARDGAWIRYDVWWLSPDGRVTGNYVRERQASRGSRVYDYGQVTGSWQASDNTLCVDAEGIESMYYGKTAGPARRVCYRLAKGGYGRNEYVATDTATGFAWQLFLYPAGE